MKNKLLIIGAMYSRNLGDAVICDIVNKICTEKGFETTLLSITGSSGFSAINADVQISIFQKIRSKITNSALGKIILMNRHYKNLINQLHNLDVAEYKAVIFAGGQLFMEYFALPIFLIVKWAEKNNIPVIFNCCGMGEFKNRIIQNRLKIALNSPTVISITLRDGVELFEKMKINKKAEIIADPALDSALYYPKQASNEKKLGIGLIGIRNYLLKGINVSENYFFTVVSSIVNELNSYGLDYEFFTNGEIDDFMLTTEFCVKLGLQNRIAKKPETSTDLVNLISGYDRIISFRLHSHIIAASYDIPTIGFVWDRKVREFLTTVGREDYIVDFNNNIKIDSLKLLLRRFLAEEKANYRFTNTSSNENICKLLSEIDN